MTSNLPMIVLISGKAEAGKTTAANILKRLIREREPEARVTIVPYAAHVKNTAKLLFDWNGVKDEAGRQLLQWWGTDVVRAQYPDFWVEEVMRLVDVARDQLDSVIIDDVRFPAAARRWSRPTTIISCRAGQNRRNRPMTNELTVRVERPGHENALTPEQRRHPSETALDVFPHDCHVFARDVAQLERKMEVVLDAIPTRKEARR